MRMRAQEFAKKTSRKALTVTVILTVKTPLWVWIMMSPKQTNKKNKTKTNKQKLEKQWSDIWTSPQIQHSAKYGIHHFIIDWFWHTCDMTTNLNCNCLESCWVSHSLLNTKSGYKLQITIPSKKTARGCACVLCVHVCVCVCVWGGGCVRVDGLGMVVGGRGAEAKDYGYLFTVLG